MSPQDQSSKDQVRAQAGAGGSFGTFCKVTDPAEVSSSLALKVLTATKLFDAEGYINQGGGAKIIETVVVQDQGIGTDISGTTEDGINYAAAGIPSDYGKRTCFASAEFMDDTSDTQARDFLAMPKKLTFTINGLTNSATCSTCTNGNRTYTLEYNTVVTGAWGEQLANSICGNAAVRLDINSITTTGALVTLKVKGTFSSPTAMAFYKKDPWDFTFPIVVIPNSTPTSCNSSWPTSISISPV